MSTLHGSLENFHSPYNLHIIKKLPRRIKNLTKVKHYKIMGNNSDFKEVNSKTYN